MDKQLLRKMLSRPFGTVKQNSVTGEREEVLVDGKAVVTGYGFLAEYEVNRLLAEIEMLEKINQNV